MTFVLAMKRLLNSTRKDQGWLLVRLRVGGRGWVISGGTREEEREELNGGEGKGARKVGRGGTTQISHF